MCKLLRSLSLLIALLASAAVPAQMPAAGAAPAADPYEGRADVADQGAAAREPALREALAQVLVRVSGPSAPGAAPMLLARASTLVSRYGYDRAPAGGLQLVAVFDRRAVDAQLRSAGLPVWGYMQATSEAVPVLVRGLRGTADYVRALNAMRGIPGMRALSIQAASGDQLQALVTVEGGGGRIASALSGNRDLAVENGAASGGTLLLQLRP